MKVFYHGHSCVSIETNNAKILIDPFINGNNLTDLDANTVHADYILLTHGHGDHVGDTVAIAKRCNATVIAMYELGILLQWAGVESVHTMSIGGGYNFEFGRVTMTPAIHSSGFVDESTKTIHYAGNPAGLVIEIEGKTILHAGDTSLYSDMKLTGNQFAIDLAFLPIGDNYTMGIDDAVIAANWLQVKRVVPVHYNTFPAIEQDPYEFVEKLEGARGIVMKAGEFVEL